MVHAMGPGYGEGIVLTIGRRFVLGIDCCTALVQPGLGGKSYLEKILAPCGQPYIVWVLSHFHFDHFQSFSLLLDKLERNLERLVVPADYLSADLADLANHAREDAGDPAFYLSKDEYSRVRRRLESFPTGVVSTLSGQGSLLEMTLRIRGGGRTIVARGDIFGPSYKTAAELRGNSVLEIGSGDKKRSEANHTSYIVRVRAGRFDSLFLGDSPSVRTISWSLACNQPMDLFLLKVAHHGAEDGTSDDLLRSIGQKARRRIAVICPFAAHNLPQGSILNMLKRYGFRTRVSGAKRTSASLKSSLLSRSELSGYSNDLLAYRHDLNVKVIRAHL